MALSRKTFGALSQVSSTTISPAYGATPVAGNLLVATVWSPGQSSNLWAAAPSGWTQAFKPASDGTYAVCVYTKVAAGGDATPTLTWSGASSVLLGFITEVQGATFNAASAIENSAMATASASSPVTVTAPAADLASGNYILALLLENNSTSITDTTTLTFNNGVSQSAMNNNDATTSATHFRYADGVTTGHSSADNCQFASGSMKLSSLGGIILSIKGVVTNSVNISDSGLGEVTAAPATAMTNGLVAFGTTTVQRVASQFQTDANGMKPISVSVNLEKVASPTDNVILEIWSDSSGSPGSIVDFTNATATVTGSGLPTSFGASGWRTFQFPYPITLAASTKYWVVLRRSGSNDNTNNYNVLNWNGTADSHYITNVTSVYNGSTWSGQSGVIAMSFFGDHLPFRYSTALSDVVWEGTDAGSTSGQLPWGQATGNLQQIATAYVPSANRSISQIVSLLNKSGAPSDNVSVQIQSDNANKPSGTVLASSNTIAGSGLSGTGFVFTTVNFALTSPLALTAGTKYWIVYVRSGAASDTNYYNVSGPGTHDSTLTNYSEFNGTSWVTNTGTVGGTGLTISDWTTSAKAKGVSLTDQGMTSGATQSIVATKINSRSITDTGISSFSVTLASNRTRPLSDAGLSVSNQPTTGSFSFGTTTSPRLAMAFTPPANMTISGVSLWLQKNNAPGDNVVVNLRADSSGLPASADLATGGSINASGLTTSFAEYQFPFTGPGRALTGGTQYWISLNRGGATDNTNNYTCQNGLKIPATVYGQTATSPDGTTWTAQGTVLAMSVFGDSVVAGKLNPRTITDTGMSTTPDGGITRVKTSVKTGLASSGFTAKTATPFPSTPVLDNFNRANENPLSQGGVWSGTSLILLGLTNLQVATNQITTVSSSNNAVGLFYRNNVSYADTEVYVTYTGAANSFVGVVARWDDTNQNGYLAILGGGSVTLTRYDGGAGSTVATYTPASSAAGDRIGLRIIGGGIETWYCQSGGSWTKLGTFFDNTYASGNVGVYVKNGSSIGTGGSADDFFGGIPVIGGDDAFTDTDTGIGISPFTGGGAKARTDVDTGIGISPFTGGGGKAVTFTKTGLGKSDNFIVSGGDAFTDVDTGLAQSTFTGHGPSAPTDVDTGTGIAPFTGGGGSVWTKNQRGTGISQFVGSGAKARTDVDTGLAISPFTGGGGKALTFTKTGVGISPFTGSGPEVYTPGSSTYIKTGIGISDNFTGHGADAFTDVDTGIAPSAFTGHGADAFTDTDTGIGISPFTGGGPDVWTKNKSGLAKSDNFTGGGADAFTDTDTGLAFSAFTGKGADAFTDVDTGVGISPFTGGGPDAFTLNRTGKGISDNFTGHGADAFTDVDTGVAISPFTGNGPDAFTDSDTGVGVSPFTGGGPEIHGHEYDKSGAGVIGP